MIYDTCYFCGVGECLCVWPGYALFFDPRRTVHIIKPNVGTYEHTGCFVRPSEYYGQVWDEWSAQNPEWPRRTATRSPLERLRDELQDRANPAYQVKSFQLDPEVCRRYDTLLQDLSTSIGIPAEYLGLPRRR